MSNPIVDFFHNIGRALASVFGVIKKIVPEEKLLAGIELVTAAALKFTDNADRRNWVITELHQRFPLISESVARLIVELAVAQVKHGLAKAAGQADAAVQG